MLVSTGCYARLLVPASGFRVIPASDLALAPDADKPFGVPSWVLVRSPPDPQNPDAFDWREVDPFENAGAFRELADLDIGNPADVERFAGRYGFLSTERGFRGAKPGAGWPAVVHGEAERVWAHHATHMRLAVTVWDMIRGGDRKGLERLIRWRASGSGNPPAGTSDEDAGWVFDSRPDQKPGVLPPWLHVRGRVHVPENVGPGEPVESVSRMWLRSFVSGFIGNTKLQLVAGPDGSDVLNHFAPTLAESLWFQFAQSVAGRKMFRQCRTCGKWYELPPNEKGRPDKRKARKVFCGEACKMKDYRERKAKPKRGGKKAK